MKQYKPKKYKTEDIDFQVYDGRKKTDFDTWKVEAQKFMDYSFLNRIENSGHKYYQFEHLGKTFFLVDTPESWRVNRNTVGPYYRWEFMENVPGFLETFIIEEGKESNEHIHYYINTGTAKNAEKAIELFKSLVVRVSTGADLLKENFN